MNNNIIKLVLLVPLLITLEGCAVPPPPPPQSLPTPELAQFNFGEEERGSVVVIRFLDLGATPIEVRSGSMLNRAIGLMTTPDYSHHSQSSELESYLDSREGVVGDGDRHQVEVDVANGDGTVETLQGRMMFSPVAQDASVTVQRVWSVSLEAGTFSDLLDSVQPLIRWRNGRYQTRFGSNGESLSSPSIAISWVLWVTNLPQLLDN